MNRGDSRPKRTDSGKSSILIKEIDQEYEFPYGKFLFLRDNDLPPFSFKLLFSG